MYIQLVIYKVTTVSYSITYGISSLSNKITITKHIFVLYNESYKRKVWIDDLEFATLVPHGIESIVSYNI